MGTTWARFWRSVNDFAARQPLVASIGGGWAASVAANATPEALRWALIFMVGGCALGLSLVAGSALYLVGATIGAAVTIACALLVLRLRRAPTRPLLDLTRELALVYVGLAALSYVGQIALVFVWPIGIERRVIAVAFGVASAIIILLLKRASIVRFVHATERDRAT